MELSQQIKDAILETLVIDNKNSLKYAVDRILKIIDKREHALNEEIRRMRDSNNQCDPACSQY
jgi:hypothetical protein